ncbi:MAG: hypothetical protein BGO67_02705 [Alphaproteobacteria bacterium 41-28]|nr:MAG: hypothetical protein BGO67_02705 [Alphaproteobacteria bacterium 41-28]
MNDPLSELYDIEGIDAISWWPLAFGWLLVVVISTIVVLFIFIYYYKRRLFKQSWQYGILNQLSVMQRNLNEENAQASVTELSELIRRIGMHQYSRPECAGLEGKTWLEWLRQHDPNQFDWEAKGKWLIEAPYAPNYRSIPKEDILNFIKAIRAWVR